jgi:predicted MFS family arabinose efflux permease
MIEEGSAATEQKGGIPGEPLRLTRSEWFLLLVLAAVQFTHIIDFVIVMPLGPVFKSALNLSVKEFGWMVSAYAFSAGVTGLFGAWFLDRFDRKKALLVLYAGFTGGTLFCAAAPNYTLLVASRAVAGGFAGVLAANVLAIVGDVLPESRRGTGMGVIMSAFSVASIVGIPLGLWLSNGGLLAPIAFLRIPEGPWMPFLAGWRAPFAFLGLLSVAVWVQAALVLPPLRGHLARAHGPSISTWQIFSNTNHLSAYALMVVLVMSSFVVVPYMTIYLVNNLGVRKEDLGHIWLWGGVATLLTMNVVGRLADRYGKLFLFRIFAALTMVPVLILTNLPPVHLVVVLSVTTMFMIASSGRMVPAVAMVTACALPRYRGSFLSINSSLQQTAMGVAPLLAALILGESEDSAGTQPLSGYPWVGLLSAGFMLLSVFLGGFLRPAAPVAEAKRSVDNLATTPHGTNGTVTVDAPAPVVARS